MSTAPGTPTIKDPNTCINDENIKPQKISSSGPSDDEKKSVVEIRSCCSDLIKLLKYQHDDVIGDWRLLRFIRTVNGDVKKAIKNYRIFLSHRIEYNHLIEDLAQEVRGMTSKEFIAWYEVRRNPYMPFVPFAGEAKDGSIYMWIYQGGSEGDKFVMSRPDDLSLVDDLMVMIQCHEWALWYLNENCHRLNKMCYIIKCMDFQNLNSNPLSMSKLREFNKIMMSFMGIDYCDGDKEYIALNTSTFFNVLYSVIKMFMTSRQRAKMKLMSVDDFVATFRDTSILPVSFGGPSTSIAERLCYQRPDDKEIEALLKKRVLLRTGSKSHYPEKLDGFTGKVKA